MTRPSAPLRTVLLDLDGTLLDTAPDLVGAVNQLATEEGRTTSPVAALRSIVTRGGAGLIEAAFPDSSTAERSRLLQRFLQLYSTDIAWETTFFPGFDSVFEVLSKRQLSWGIVTDKPRWLAEPLLTALGIMHRSGCVVTGDSVAERKPSALPLLHAAQLLGVSPAECIYVGDAQRDIQAGRAAGMRTFVAMWGYLDPNDSPETWLADGLLSSPSELANWLQQA